MQTESMLGTINVTQVEKNEGEEVMESSFPEKDSDPEKGDELDLAQGRVTNKTPGVAAADIDGVRLSFTHRGLHFPLIQVGVTEEKVHSSVQDDMKDKKKILMRCIKKIV